MSEKGINDLKELAEFLCEMGNGAGKAMEDGKLSLSDALYFSKAALSAPKAFMGISNVSDEYFDLDEAEKKELSDFISEKLDMPQDSVEGIVEKVIKAAIELSGVVKQIIDKKQGA